MEKVCIFAHGKMAEWSNAAVLKTVDLHGSGGSNPSLSAKPCNMSFIFMLHFYFTIVSLLVESNSL